MLRPLLLLSIFAIQHDPSRFCFGRGDFEMEFTLEIFNNKCITPLNTTKVFAEFINNVDINTCCFDEFRHYNYTYDINKYNKSNTRYNIYPFKGNHTLNNSKSFYLKYNCSKNKNNINNIKNTKTSIYASIIIIALVVVMLVIYFVYNQIDDRHRSININIRRSEYENIN